MMVFSLAFAGVVMLVMATILGMGMQKLVDHGEMAKAKGALALMIILFPLGSLLVFLAGNLAGAAQ